MCIECLVCVRHPSKCCTCINLFIPQSKGGSIIIPILELRKLRWIQRQLKKTFVEYLYHFLYWNWSIFSDCWPHGWSLSDHLKGLLEKRSQNTAMVSREAGRLARLLLTHLFVCFRVRLVGLISIGGLKSVTQPGTVAHDSNPSTLGGWGGQITWG